MPIIRSKRIKTSASSAPKRKRQRITVGPEMRVQIALLDWLSKFHPEAFRHVIKIDNEGKRSKVGHHLAKRAGLHLGASDIFIAWPNRNGHGLWLEIKPDGWTCTASDKEHVDRQIAFINKMIIRGYAGKLGVGIDECIKIVTEYLKCT